jgi:quinone-modifying oxidoreductase subunit QmoC
MSKANQAMVQKYQNDFLKEVEANVEEGNWVKMCMQCGVCSGSCPLGAAWEHPPQEIFMMIRAGKRDEVLKSESMWMCTSCYNCIVRCPRELPITHIMHGLANYAHRLGIAHKQNPTRRFATIFWNNISTSGRVNELKLSIGLYFMDGIVRHQEGSDAAGGLGSQDRAQSDGPVCHIKGKSDQMLKRANRRQAHSWSGANMM